jgi:hypothetical protein
MKAFLFSLSLLLSATALWADQELKYEPAVAEISGAVTKGKAQHPNGSWFDFQLIKLDAPASIQGDGQKDSFNETETNIREIQVYSNDAAIRKRISQLTGKKATLKGTLFHAQTAWHIRELVLMVTDVQAAK